MAKLRTIGQQLGAEVEEEALHLIAKKAEGGLRDAESLFDQILAFKEGCITAASVTSILGMMPRETYFEIDRPKEGRRIKAFEIAQRVFAEGKDLSFFIEGLIDHLRQILLFKISGRNSPLLALSESEKDQYEEASKLYAQEQCLDLIEYLLEAQNQLKHSAFGKTSLETILLHVMRSHCQLPIEYLVRRLCELEQLIQMPNQLPQEDPPKPASAKRESQPADIAPLAITPTPAAPTMPPASPPSSLTEDPTPLHADLGNKKEQKEVQPAKQTLPIHKYDTLFHFAAVELEGKLQKK